MVTFAKSAVSAEKQIFVTLQQRFRWPILPEAMARICPECGVTSPGEVDFCELCGHDLRGSATPSGGHPHRMPSGLLRVPGEADSGTDQGSRPIQHTEDLPVVQVQPVNKAAVGEAAARVSLSGDFTGLEGSIVGRVKLVVEQGKIIGEQYLLSESLMLIGRVDPEANFYPDIDLSGQDNEYVQRQHARIQFIDGGAKISVEHIGGHNQTLVNNSPLEVGELVELRVGDRLRVGRVVMRLVWFES